MITIRYMLQNIHQETVPEPEIYGLQYAMYLQKPGEWFPNTGDNLNLDRQQKCKYVLNKAKMSVQFTILTRGRPIGMRQIFS